MYVHKTKYLKTSVLAVVFSLAIIYLIYAVFALSFMFLQNVYNNNLFFKGYMSDGVFILSFTSGLIAYFILLFSNKNNWPVVKARILTATITNMNQTVPVSATVRFEYSFIYNENGYFKRNFSKIIFKSKEEFISFKEKLSESQSKFIDVYIFKRSPKYSTITKKMSISNIGLAGFFSIVSLVLLLFGMMYRLIELGIAKMVITDFNGSSNTDIVLQKPIGNLFNYQSSIIILSLILLLFIITFIYTIALIRSNKLNYGISELLPEKIEISTRKMFDEKICANCNCSNDFDSIYCFNCGKELISGIRN